MYDAAQIKMIRTYTKTLMSLKAKMSFPLVRKLKTRTLIKNDNPTLDCKPKCIKVFYHFVQQPLSPISHFFLDRRINSGQW